jgi:hypothetical protein
LLGDVPLSQPWEICLTGGSLQITHMSAQSTGGKSKLKTSKVNLLMIARYFLPPLAEALVVADWLLMMMIRNGIFMRRGNDIFEAIEQTKV